MSYIDELALSLDSLYRLLCGTTNSKQPRGQANIHVILSYKLNNLLESKLQ